MLKQQENKRSSDETFLPLSLPTSEVSYIKPYYSLLLLFYFNKWNYNQNGSTFHEHQFSGHLPFGYLISRICTFLNGSRRIYNPALTRNSFICLSSSCTGFVLLRNLKQSNKRILTYLLELTVVSNKIPI
jgi:hypothetical protein